MKFKFLHLLSCCLYRLAFAGALLFSSSLVAKDLDGQQDRQEKVAQVKLAIRVFAEEVRAGRQVGLWLVAPERMGEFFSAGTLGGNPGETSQSEVSVQEVLQSSHRIVVEESPTAGLHPSKPMRLVLQIRMPDGRLEVRILTNGNAEVLRELARDLNAAVNIAKRLNLGLRLREQSRGQDLSLISLVSADPRPKDNLYYWLELMSASRNEAVQQSFGDLQRIFGKRDPYDVWNEVLGIQRAVRTACMNTLKGLGTDSF